MAIETERLPGLREFIALTSRKRELEADLRQVQDRLNELEPQLVEMFGEEGLQRTSIDGWTAFLQEDIWASPAEGDIARLCAALKEAGLGDMVAETVNRQTLSAWVRERLRDGEPLPDLVDPAINVSRGFRLRARKG